MSAARQREHRIGVAFSLPVPAVYRARAIVAILALRGMNNLRAPNNPVGSNPTRASTFFQVLAVTHPL